MVGEEKPWILIAGLSSKENKGKMAKEVAELLLQDKNKKVLPFGLGSKRNKDKKWRDIKITDISDVYNRMFEYTGPKIVIDFGTGNVGERIKRYVADGWNFIIGSTSPIILEEEEKVILHAKPSDEGDMVENILKKNNINYVREFCTETPPSLQSNEVAYLYEGVGGINLFVQGIKERRNIIWNKYKKEIADAKIVAVVALNMALPIVAFQKAIKDYAESNPNSLEGCSLDPAESHQEGKKDTSGTMRSMLEDYNNLGVRNKKREKLTVSDIKMIRNKGEQRELGVPEEYLGGHGWHSYVLKGDEEKLQKFKNYIHTFLEHTATVLGYKTKSSIDLNGEVVNVDIYSADGTVHMGYKSATKGELNLYHKVNGRKVYAEGTIKALEFVETKRKQREFGVYNMMDVFDGLPLKKPIAM